MSQKKATYFIIGTLLAGIFIIFYIYNLIHAIPSTFPVGKNFTVEENETLKSLSIRLEEGGYINSSLLFRTFVSSRGRDRKIKAGGYIFNQPLSLSSVVERFATGHPDVPLISVTIPEGSTASEIAILINKVIPTISTQSVMSMIEENNLFGKLFPSTYFLLPSTTADSIIKMMKTTFENKYSAFVNKAHIPEPLKDDNEVLSLAAILEGEAKTKEDMQIVAGILLARMKKGMPLQVDVAPETYTTKGVPLHPINNPGEVAISAVFNATASPYLFYLTDKDGLMHYSKTFEEHKRNIQKYLR
jgi:UPF0755 protein